MQTVADRPEAPIAIRTNLGAIFISLELSRSRWLITSLAPAGGEKMSKHVVRGGDVAGTDANAHLLPSNAIIDVPQLLSLRELAVNNIQTGLSTARGSSDRVLSDEEVRLITELLGWMQKLIVDIYGQPEAVHDTPITQLLEQELRPKSRGRA